MPQFGLAANAVCPFEVLIYRARRIFMSSLGFKLKSFQKMSLCEIYQPSMILFNNVNPFSNDAAAEETLSPLFSFTENSPEISSSMKYLETIFYDECMEFPVHGDELHASSAIHDISAADDSFMDVDEFDYIFNAADVNSIPQPVNETAESGVSYCSQQFPSDDGFCSWNHDRSMEVCETFMDKTNMHPPPVLPSEGMEAGNQLCLIHLLLAYAEAMDNQETELAEVISRHIIQKVNPVGGTTERVLYYMFQHLNKQPDYLEQESSKNFYPAFMAFYQMFPYGKFAHLVAILAILEAMPWDAEIIHLIDFDIGEGVQWAPFMEAIKYQHKEIRLTSVKLNEEDETNPSRWGFEETKRRLCDHADSYGLKMEVQEVGLQDLESMMKNMKEGEYGRKSWYAFNCHVGLPHMARIRNRNDVLEFLSVANNSLHHVKGIITYGDGDAWHNISSSCSYTTFLDNNFTHYQALLESMESNFPAHLGEARIALESLFVAPLVRWGTWDRKWEEKKQCGEFEVGVGLKGWKFSEASVVEAKEMVKSEYGVRIGFGGEKKNEMVMEWNGIPMVRVCCWIS
ncbi:nodulation-signaling pathway 2 protein-like [Sesamum indicum]|uniref:Nodulation-signaling pathway 2 protein-like n=1 Tax=Sesamum indicum TaxID=4182 RepID=A0A6I9U7B8_SESIN|nr:nodulation-signaling pathway 2 protein-like [Sesamum indicum]